MRATITEHTTSDETYCTVENDETGEVADFFGSIEDFKREVPQVTITEEIWS